MNKKTIKKSLRTLCICLTIAVLSLLAVLWYANYTVEKSSKGYTYGQVETVPYKKVGLLLGTSKILAKNRVNLFFKYRIDATVALYRSHKLRYIIISGDHSEKYYNEPADMKKELVAQGVPDSVIFLDFAGLRTLDSVIRCHEIFGQNDFMIISQSFHTERAIFIAQNSHLNVIGFNAKDPSVKFGIKTYIREYFARVKVLLDVFLNKRPKYMGDKVHMP